MLFETLILVFLHNKLSTFIKANMSSKKIIVMVVYELCWNDFLVEIEVFSGAILLQL